MRLPGKLEGWWDDHGMLLRDSDHNFVRFDVVTHETSVVIAFDDIARWLQTQNFEIADPDIVAPDFIWAGKDYSVFLRGDGGSGSVNTFLVRVERAGPKFTMLNSDFRFRWLGYLDATGTRYIYPGEKGARGAGGNGGVFLLDVTNNTTRTLVESDNRGQYSLPRFYGDSVIYYTNRQFWRIALNGSNVTPFFAPAGGASGAK